MIAGLTEEQIAEIEDKLGKSKKAANVEQLINELLVDNSPTPPNLVAERSARHRRPKRK